jgi:hypothetical protein
MGSESTPSNFSQLETQKHVLYYQLPAFARDSYTFYKLKRLHENKQWRLSRLKYIDDGVQKIERPTALITFLLEVFGDSTLEGFGLPAMGMPRNTIADYRVSPGSRDTHVKALMRDISAFKCPSHGRLLKP